MLRITIKLSFINCGNNPKVLKKVELKYFSDQTETKLCTENTLRADSNQIAYSVFLLNAGGVLK